MINPTNSDINFFTNDQDQLEVTIDTERLHIRSVTDSKQDCDYYGALFGNQEVMSKYMTGQPKSPEWVNSLINDTWVKRWHQKDPYSALAVFKKDEDDFLGHVSIGHSGEPGQSELAYLFMQKHWKQGYGSEATKVVVKEYAPATITKGYTLDGKTLEKINATARPDNPASVKILTNLGMQKVGEEEKYGALRHHYSINLTDITKKT